jgi:hypothetical protein
MHMPQMTRTNINGATIRRGTTLVYSDNYTIVGDYRGRADLYVVDYTKPGSPTLVASQAEVDYYVNPSRTKLVYSIVGTSDTGIYVYDLP